MGAVPAATAIQTPTLINRTDPQLAPVGPSISLSVAYSLASIFSNFSPTREMGDSETAFSYDGRFPNVQTWREF